MTVTRTLNQITSNNTTVIQETTVDTADPNTKKSSNFTQGSQYKYDGTTGPLATKAYHREITMSSGTATLDLTALVDTSLTITMSGLKMLEIFVKSDSTNTHAITIAPSSAMANGYSGWVGASGLILNAANDENKLGPMSGNIAVDGTHKSIDITGTGSEKLFIALIFG